VTMKIVVAAAGALANESVDELVLRDDDERSRVAE
jgi:hypothetical protein